MKQDELQHIVLGLIERGKEGNYWDFKSEWHSDITALIKDIICFANTVHENDCYIIFGVDDNLEVTGMTAPRRKQADIIDTLSNLMFAGDIIPKITVETVMLKDKEIDVLIIHNVEKTPVFLKKAYGAMNPGCIYTRNEDRNTPDKGNAEIEQIENLWKKRFGLTRPALSFIVDHLARKIEWTEKGRSFYNIYRPEYCIQIREDEDVDRGADVFYAYLQTNERISFNTLDIIANNTVLDSYQIAVLDSGRLSIPIPEQGFIPRDLYHQNVIAYRYYVKDSDCYKLLCFLYNPENHDEKWAFQRHMEVVLLFSSKAEKEGFDEYIIGRIHEIDEYIASNRSHMHLVTDSDKKTEVYKEQILTGKVLKRMLEDFRCQSRLKMT